MNRFVMKGAVRGAIALAVICLIGYSPEKASAGPVIPIGNVIVGTGNGFYSEFTPTGTLVTQFNTLSASSDETGCGFDSSGDLLTTNFEAQSASKFDPTGVLTDPAFGGPFDCNPESVTLDNLGNVYFGQAGCTHEILEFSSTGVPVATFSPTIEEQGSDWIDLQSNQCTIFYTSEGVQVLTFNKCTNTQGPNFNVAPLPGSHAFAHRTRPNGEVLVADSSEVTRLSAAGVQIQHYLIPGATLLFALNLDPDGTSFWTGDMSNGIVYKVDIATGTVLQSWNAAVAPNFVDIAGLCIKGEITPTEACTATSTISGSMEGNLPIHPGDTIKAGFDFTIPGNHAADTVTFSNVMVTLSIKCPSGPPVPVTITMPNQMFTDLAGNTNWLPSGNQSSPLVYQGSFTTPSTLCGGQTGHAPAGATFSANVDGTTTSSIHVRFHYADNTSGSWSGTAGYCGH